jgi:transposase
MTRTHATDIPPFNDSCAPLRQDLGAVDATVSEPWSNGSVEGHIHR